MKYENLFNSIIYYDVGAIGGMPYPFIDINNQYLKRWIGFDPNFEEEYRVDGKNTYYGYAISDREEQNITYYLCRRRVNNSLFLPNEEFFKSRHCRKRCLSFDKKTIRCRRLDNVIEENGGEIDILKIDAHGSEYPILVGTGSYLKDIVVIHIEIWNKGWYTGAEGGRTIHESLLNNGFIPRMIVKAPKGRISRDATAKGDYIDVVYFNNNKMNEKYSLCEKLYGITNSNISKILEKNMRW